MKIGYQGIEGCNSLAAARDMAQKLGWTQVEYVPLVHSQGVAEGLRSGLVDYGVMATLNHAAGVVTESEEALASLPHRVLTTDCIPIHHCLFIRDACCAVPELIASHPQALAQCRGHLKAEYPEAVWQETEDTAMAARYLVQGKLPATAGVLCRRDAGESLGLYLLRENMEDDTRNATEFVLIERK